MQYILASQSPRRKFLLETIIPKFDIIVSNADETISPDIDPVTTVKILAKRKGESIAKQYPDAVVISADTIVVTDGIILGKPENEADAEHMLHMLSGKTHQVITGVCIMYNNTEHIFANITDVTFKNLSDLEIKNYIATGEPMDKAGSYGLQGDGSKFVTNIDGDKFNVIGLPISDLKNTLCDLKLL